MQRKYNVEEKKYPNYSLYGWKGKLTYVVSRIHGNSCNQGIRCLRIDDNKISSDDTDKTKDKGVSELKLLNKTAYNDLLLAQEKI